MLVSVAALWELTIKTSSGKLRLPADLETMVANQGFAVLSIQFPHLTHLAGLPRLHRDPFDRMMIAQALAEGIPIATGDRVFAAYGVQVDSGQVPPLFRRMYHPQSRRFDTGHAAVGRKATR